MEVLNSAKALIITSFDLYMTELWKAENTPDNNKIQGRLSTVPSYKNWCNPLSYLQHIEGLSLPKPSEQLRSPASLFILYNIRTLQFSTLDSFLHEIPQKCTNIAMR
jgi:hypothetical protein